MLDVLDIFDVLIFVDVLDLLNLFEVLEYTTSITQQRQDYFLVVHKCIYLHTDFLVVEILIIALFQPNSQLVRFTDQWRNHSLLQHIHWYFDPTGRRIRVGPRSKSE